MLSIFSLTEHKTQHHRRICAYSGGVMPPSAAALRRHVVQLSEPIRESLLKAHYIPPEGSNVSLKSTLLSLLPENPNPDPNSSTLITNFALCCAALASSVGATHDHLSWVPDSLSVSADLAFRALSREFSDDEGEFVTELVREVLPLLKDTIKESSIDKEGDGNEVSAAVARAPVSYAVVAAHQLRWLVTQVGSPNLRKLCSLVIPCTLTCLDHWSPEVKGQGMMCFIHLGKTVNSAELSWYGDVILDACCQNIASADEIWHLVVETSVVMVTCIQGNNPRSSWFEKMLSEMLSHLERQPRNKERRLAWLMHIEQLFNVLGLVLLAHFRRIFPLFFQWMHVDDDESILLVLRRLHTVLTLTWIRNTPYIDRLVDELATLYKDAALKVAREEIRLNIVKILVLLQHSKGLQFESAWDKHKNDSNLKALNSSLVTTEAVH